MTMGSEEKEEGGGQQNVGELPAEASSPTVPPILATLDCRPPMGMHFLAISSGCKDEVLRWYLSRVEEEEGEEEEEEERDHSPAMLEGIFGISAGAWMKL